MHKKLLLFIALALSGIAGHTQTYIRNVTITDVVNQTLKPGQTIVINNGLISDIQPIIQSATINPAKILNHQDSLGSIAIGKKADLILLNANPVDDIHNVSKIELVINKGYVINPDTLIAITPETLVQQQLNAYNARNLDAFLEPYADSVELYNFPDKLLGKGKEMMRQQYSMMFNQLPDLHCELKGRIIRGSFVIDHESITGIGQPTPLEAVAMYEIKDGKIVKVYFIE